MVYLPKSPVAHPCLEIEKIKANGTYHCGQVLKTLRDDFKNKCYICETKEPHSINIEHFKSHRGNRDLMFDWGNLFYCCWHCNNTKGSRFEEILNCTLEQDGVDTKIKYEINPFPGEKAKITALENTEKVKNTVKLLNEVYNGSTELKKLESDNIRTTLLREISYFQKLLSKYYKPPNNERKLFFKNKIIQQLNSESSFAAFKRWIVRDNEYLKPDFIDYL